MISSTIIISVYKDIDNLELILDSLSTQTLLPNEIIISEDGNSEEMSTFVQKMKNKHTKLNIIHIFQDDIGWRKNRALNNAIVTATSEYLIFIDGDCIPYSKFIEAHVNNAKENVVLCGKRMELGERYSKLIKQRKLKVSDIEKNFFLILPKLIIDKTNHLEDGIPLSNGNFIYKLLKKRYVRHIIGCNFSCFKDDFIKINGFNEDFINPSEGEDVDPSWRFRAKGVELVSCRLIANIAHIYHEKRFNHEIGEINRKIMYKNMEDNISFCKNGLDKYLSKEQK
ncbi:glycosyl transferase family 2 [Halarcobacter ebronensis]|uniref:Glycosyl transferase family 2 n=1 Tax=Halarcobacter ebronensis TaxID=1462615 RepID=A0A4Q0YF50_9BACT|nr:glycosyltransferase [Halarcobacter ebronensis]RXJ69150.1 glycosyl transferase family 2 [Halarcobacter ebronensis]